MKHSLFTLGIVAASLSVATLSCTTQQQPTEVTWGTFNIRYDNPGDSLNNWQYRKDNVAQFIKSQDIDIVGMQEVLHNQLEDLKSRLPEYAEVGVGREDGKTKGEYSPLFYKKDRFEVLDSILAIAFSSPPLRKTNAQAIPVPAAIPQPQKAESLPEYSLIYMQIR